MTDETEVTIGGAVVRRAGATNYRLALMLWGDSGVGKTTFACTAPGTKLILNFDPDGPVSVAGRDDVLVADFSDRPAAIVDQMKREDPFGISDFLAGESGHKIDTLIVDSLTSLSEKSLEHAVAMVARTIKGGTPPSIEAPGLQGYGYRNAIVMQCLKNILSITSKFGVNVIFIAHEKGETDDQGSIVGSTVLLGGQLPGSTSIKLSEVWFMDADSRGNRRIAVKPCRSRKPMKSRMFVTGGAPEFNLKYDADVPDEGQDHTLAKWVTDWAANGYNKLPLPG